MQQTDGPFGQEDLEALRKLHDKLEEIDGVTGVLSMFSAVTAPEDDTEPKSKTSRK